LASLNERSYHQSSTSIGWQQIILTFKSNSFFKYNFEKIIDGINFLLKKKTYLRPEP
jgi:hypothetical protein